MNINKAARKKADWLAYCLEIGWEKDHLDGLSKLWDDYYDENGNVKPLHPSTPIEDIKDIRVEDKRAGKRIEYTTEYTWFDNFAAYWIIENSYDGIKWQPTKKKIAMSLSLINGEDALQIANEIIKGIQLFKTQKP